RPAEVVPRGGGAADSGAPRQRPPAVPGAGGARRLLRLPAGGGVRRAPAGREPAAGPARAGSAAAHLGTVSRPHGLLPGPVRPAPSPGARPRPAPGVGGGEPLAPARISRSRRAAPLPPAALQPAARGTAAAVRSVPGGVRGRRPPRPGAGAAAGTSPRTGGDGG